MQMTKKLEAEILKIYNAYWDNYLKGDVEAMQPLLADEYTQVGSAESEVFSNKKDAVQFLYDTIEQVAGILQMRNRKTILEQQDNTILIHEFCDLFALADNTWIFYSKFRASTLIQQKEQGWKIIHQHSSFPDTKTEDGQNIAIDKIAAENQQLREAVKRRTVELEESNRELKIESSLERVRAVALSMNKPDDMLEVCKTIALQLQFLGVKDIRNVQTAIFYPARGTYMNYEFYAKHDKTFVTDTSYTDHAVPNAFAEQMFKGKGEVFITHLKDKEVKDWLAYQKSTNVFIDSFLENAPSLNYYWHSLGPVALGISTYVPLGDNDLQLFQRFLKVFDLSYRRYLDIEKAIAQAKEAQIETSLERVRAQAMAMRTPEDLSGICEVLYAELNSLGFTEIRNAMINIHDDEKETFVNYDYSDEIGKSINHLHYNIHPLIEKQIKQIRSGEGFSETSYTGKDLENMIRFRKNIGEKDDPRIEQADALYYYFYSIGTGSIGISTFSIVAGEKLEVLKRFRNVFTLAYQRYTDIAQAEAQAREAEIELALERVRARTMAMQHSDELAEASFLLDSQVRALGIKTRGCAFNIYGDNESTEWFIAEAGTMPAYKTPRENIFLRYYEAGQAGEAIHIETFEGDACAAHYDYLCTLPVAGESLKKFKESGGSFPEKQTDHVTYFKFGYLLFITLEPVPDAHDIFKRFAKVFEQTYTRFLDLQKAEAQAREALIEAALEKVRSRTMAMQSSNELQETAAVLFQEFKKLGTDDMQQVTIGIYNEEESVIDFRVTNWSGGGEQENRSFQLDMNEPTLVQPNIAAWKAGKKSAVFDLTGEALQGWLNYRNKISGITINTNDTGGRRVITAAYFSKGHLTISTLVPLAEETIKTLERFAAVFDGTYTRFLDLEKAEAQAKEAQIETALERVRSRTLAMQKSDELAETAAEVFRQLISLGIEPNRLYIGIVKEESGDMEMWATDEDGTQVGKKFMFNKNENVSVKKLFDGWKAKERSVIVDMQGKELEDYFHYLNNVMHIPFKGGLTQKRRVQSVAYFSKGFIGMASPDGQGDETIQLLERFAAVFNLTFTRFNDLKIAEAHAQQAEQDLIAIKEAKQKAEEALTELQATQKQLIQSEKMASLGELTAGIAHEIQNPLNFVNNFSELSNELMDEMNAEIEKGDLEEAKLIANDIKQNLEKINHHGKRADAIVKGMLQHSRSSNGAKEPTDINKLADEYLRLAYHGLRAKDKSFNATLKTDFDETISKINIIPQDMGRVILNLITNAFYVVDEKKKSGIEAYEPTVSVRTKKINDKVEIIVADNGNGIPQKVLDKIFQPFFTTKPTGQGTGLGLSLSYDIVKAHGGELIVETKEGEGAEFIIQLPIINA
jgi:signal transduction histidine kinase/ketosteroid isomerase-like protein